MQILKKFLILMTISLPLLSKTINLSQHNSYTIKGEIDQKSVSKTIKDITNLHFKLEKGKPIYLVLLTPGGSIFYGNLLITHLKSLDREIHTISIYAASMGFQLIQSLGKRYALSNAILMAHPGWTSCEGNQYEMESCLYRLKMFDFILSKAAADRIGMDHIKYINMIRSEKWFMGTDLLGSNVIDELVSIKCSEDLMKMDNEITIDIGITEITMKESACPTVIGSLNNEDK